MGLYERLLGTGAPKLPVHAFMAALGEYARGKMTRQQVIDAFALGAAEQAELDALAARVIWPEESVSVGGVVTLTNVGTAYDGSVTARGLGFARIQTAGVTAFEFAVGTDRNGAAGMVSWQLWDDTNSTEVARIDDVSGAGSKYVQTVVDLGAPLAAGFRRVRVRCKSTVATDDPVYLGASLIIRRVERLTAVELHEVLLLGETALAPLDSAAAVKARLGV